MRKLIFFILLACSSAMAQSVCNVRTFSIRDGLAATTISGIAQTPDDLMWFSTWNGLCAFDGYSFKSFRGGDDQQVALHSNRLLMARTNSQNDIWCLSYDKHLYLFNTRECRFMDVGEMIKAKSGADVKVRDIYTLHDGYSWVVDTEGKHNFCINDSLVREGEGITLFSTDLPQVHIKKVLLDSLHRQWVFTDRGPVSVSPATLARQTLSFNLSVVCDFMVALPEMTVLAAPQGEVLIFRKSDGQPARMSFHTTIHDMKLVEGQTVAMATRQGIWMLDVASLTQQLIPTSDAVQSLFVDSKKRIWAMTDADGVLLADAKKATLTLLKANVTDFLHYTRSETPFIHEDAFGTIWGVPKGGVFAFFDETEQKWVPYRLQTLPSWEATDLPVINKFFFDRQRNIWFTGARDLTLLTFNMQPFRRLSVVSNQEARAVAFDHRQRIWVGMASGEVAVVDSGATAYLSPQGAISNLPVKFSKRIYALHEDGKHRLWIGSKGDGLFMRTPEGVIRHFTFNAEDDHSLPNNEVYDIHEMSDGAIWIATYGGGPCKYDEQGGFINVRNGLKNYPVNDFAKVRRIVSLPDGTMAMATNNGLVTFASKQAEPVFYTNIHHPDDPQSLLTGDVLQVLATGSKVWVVTLGGGIQTADAGALCSDRVRFEQVNTLNHDVGLAQSMVEDGEGRLWIVRENTVNCYLPDADSVVHFGAHLWGERTRFTEAKPCVHDGQLLLATMGGVLEFAPADMAKSAFTPNIVFTSVWFHDNGEKRPILHREVLKVPSDRRNLSIEFAALDYTGDQMKYQYRIEGVDHQWMEVGEGHRISFNDLPPGRLRLLVRATNADGVWSRAVASLEIDSQPTFWETWWAKMLYALLVAAFAAVAVYIYRLRTRNRMQQQLDDMKTQFFTDISHRLRTPLTLIGGPVSEVLNTEELSSQARSHLQMVERNASHMLALVNRMLHYSKSHGIFISDDNAAQVIPSSSEDEVKNQPADAAYEQENTKSSSDENVILVVEDNPDLRAFLVSILRDDYRVLQAENGEVGLETTIREMPDFIITDVMMPRMDGMTMVHHIKQNADTCHIPIIILSAKASLDDRLQGLREGIDDYITKPFSATYLRQRVQNIMAQRTMLQQRFLESLAHTASSIASDGDTAHQKDETDDDKRTQYALAAPEIEDADEQMMQRLLVYINDHIGDADLKIEQLADAVNLSRTVFYGKVKAMVGLSPVDFLRHLRIQRAEQLIALSSENFSQIAYAVGFSDPKYFTRCFKKETGMTPSEYRAQA